MFSTAFFAVAFVGIVSIAAMGYTATKGEIPWFSQVLGVLLYVISVVYLTVQHGVGVALPMLLAAIAAMFVGYALAIYGPYASSNASEE